MSLPIVKRAALVVALAGSLSVAWVGPGLAQDLPSQACNQGTENAHSSVPGQSGNGAAIKAHEHIPEAEGSGCSHEIGG